MSELVSERRLCVCVVGKVGRDAEGTGEMKSGSERARTLDL